MNKLWQIVAWIIIGGAFILLITVFVWLLYPYQPITLKQTPFHILTPVVKSGETVQFEVDYCKTNDLATTITHTFVDSVIYTRESFITTNLKGCRKSTIIVPVPPIPPGDYKIKTIYSYQVNPIRRIDVINYTENFKIIK